MNIWDILKTEPTRDKDLLKKAYRRVLVTVHPEDDPEGFQALRAAYEEALRLADHPEESEEVFPAEAEEGGINEDPGETAEKSGTEKKPLHEGPVTTREEMEETMQAIYASFFRRVQVSEWEKLLSEPFAASIDTAGEALFALLDFIMDHFMLPHQVYKFLCDHYDLNERREDLLLRYPMRYIDYILANGIYPDAVDFTKFSGPEDYDYEKLIDVASIFSRAVKSGDLATSRNLYPKLQNLPVKNPEIDVLLLRFLWERDQKDAAVEGVKKLLLEYPEDAAVLTLCGDFHLRKHEPEEAEKCFLKAKELTADSPFLRGRMGEVLLEKGEFETARDIFYDILKDEPYDTFYRSMAMEASRGVIGQKEEALERLSESGEDPEKIKDEAERLTLDLAAALYQCYMFEDGVKTLRSMEEPQISVRKVTYHNYLGRCLLSLRKVEEAEEEIQKWIDAILEIPQSDESDDAVKARRRMGYAVTLLGECRMQQHRFDEAREALDSAMLMHHEEILITLEERCRLEYMTEHFREGIQVAIDLEKRCPGNYLSSNIRAKCALRLEFYEEAGEYAERAIRVYPYASEPYLVLSEIALNREDYKSAEKVAERYEKLNPESDAVKYIRARIAVDKDKDWNKAKELLLPGKKNLLSENTDIEHKDEYYILLGNALKNLEKPKEALAEYENALKEEPDSPEILSLLGDTHRRLLHFEEALTYFQKEEEIRANGKCFLNQAFCLMQLLRYQEAKDKALKAAILEADRFDTTLVAGKLLLGMNFSEEGLGCIRIAEQLGGSRGHAEVLRQKCRGLLMQKKYRELEEILTQEMQKSGDFDLRVRYLDLLTLTGRFADAEGLARKMDWSKDLLSMKYDKLFFIRFRAGNLDGMRALMAESEGLTTRGVSVVSAFQYELLGRMQLLKKKYKEAEQNLLTASEKDPGNKYRYLSFLAECASHLFGGKSRVNRYIGSLENLEQGGGTRWEYLIHLARGYRVMKEYDKTEQLLRKVLAEHPWNREMNDTVTKAYEELGNLYLAKKDKQNALTSFQNAKESRGADIMLDEMISKLKLELGL